MSFAGLGELLLWRCQASPALAGRMAIPEDEPDDEDESSSGDGLPTFVPDIANDLQYVDGLQSMTLRVTGEEDVLLTRVLDEPVTWKELEASNGQVLQGDHMFLWPAADSDEPPIGAYLIDSAGETWTVLTVTYKDQVDSYETQCRRLKIVSSLDNLATVQRASYRKGQGNDSVPRWRVVRANIPARFQPSVEAAQVFLGGEFSNRTYRVIFAYPVPMELAGGEYRLIDAANQRYRVMQYVDEQRIDTLPVAIAVKIVEGAGDVGDQEGAL